MLSWTNRFYRRFARQLTKHAWLYTEMVSTGAVLHGDQERALYFDPIESPLALQLGGSDPESLARCAKIAQGWGYAEINLNLGCPSPRVQRGTFGACLMREPRRVCDCIAAMRDAVSLEVTVKQRIGLGDTVDYAFLRDFTAQVHEAGCNVFIVHARPAILQRLSPKQNREIPVLDYDVVYRLKKDLPQVQVILNGGIVAHSAAQQHLQRVDGIMMGRAAYRHPWLLTRVDANYYGAPSQEISRHAVLNGLRSFIEAESARGIPFSRLVQPLLPLFRGEPGARQWRAALQGGSGDAWPRCEAALATM